MIKDAPWNNFSKIGVQKASIFVQEPKKALWNPARRHSKALEMETNGPRDLKLGLK